MAKLGQFRGDARCSNWLYRIAYACFLQACREKAWHAGDSDDGEVERLPAPPHALDLHLDIRGAMQRLSTAEQTVLLHSAQLV